MPLTFGTPNSLPDGHRASGSPPAFSATGSFVDRALAALGARKTALSVDRHRTP